MDNTALDHRDYRRIADAIAYLDAHWRERPSLAAAAAAANLSPWHFNRLFRRWAGVTPKQYLQWLALDAAKLELREAEGSVLAAAYAAGCSGPSRLHDLFVSIEAMTPGEYRAGGKGVTVRYGYADSPFGRCLAARTLRGVCHLAFLDDGDDAALARLRTEWPRAQVVRDDAAATALAAVLWPRTRTGAEAGGGAVRTSAPASRAITLHLRGTNFQLQVWRALLAADGATTYGELARAIGAPRASRAVGGAVGDNPVAWLIPCHRVLRASRALGGYRWDPVRKRAMLAWEYARECSARESLRDPSPSAPSASLRRAAAPARGARRAASR